MKPSQYVPFRFTVEQDAEQAYVLLRSADGSPIQLAEMEKGEGGDWEVTLCLRPGAYRHRFYVEVAGVNVVLPGWAATSGVGRDGLDGVIEVAHPQAGPARRIWPYTTEEQPYVTHS